MELSSWWLGWHVDGGQEEGQWGGAEAVSGGRAEATRKHLGGISRCWWSACTASSWAVGCDLPCPCPWPKSAATSMWRRISWYQEWSSPRWRCWMAWAAKWRCSQHFDMIIFEDFMSILESFNFLSRSSILCFRVLSSLHFFVNLFQLRFVVFRFFQTLICLWLLAPIWLEMIRMRWKVWFPRFDFDKILLHQNHSRKCGQFFVFPYI